MKKYDISRQIKNLYMPKLCFKIVVIAYAYLLYTPSLLSDNKLHHSVEGSRGRPPENRMVS